MNHFPHRPGQLKWMVDSLDLDCSRGAPRGLATRPATAYLQYTSGSTRRPAGVMISHRNLLANFKQITSDYFLEYGKVAPPGTATVSWLPFYHDLGLILGICAPILAGVPGVFTSPVAFLQRPARWMQLLASNGHVFSAAPNFAFDLAARKTTDEDMAGLDLGDVLIIQNGAERVQPKTLRHFTERFAKFNLGEKVIRPSYGLAEATVYVATRAPAQRPQIVHFESDKLSAGRAKRCESEGGRPLISYGAPTDDFTYHPLDVAKYCELLFPRCGRLSFRLVIGFRPMEWAVHRVVAGNPRNNVVALR